MKEKATMHIFDVKAITGIIGTITTAIVAWFQEVVEVGSQVPLTDWIPLIPAVPTAIYMSFKAWEKYIHIKNGKDGNS